MAVIIFIFALFMINLLVCMLKWQIFVQVESESREKSSDNFTKFMIELNRLIMELVNSSNVEEKMGGIMVIGIFLESEQFV